MVSIVCFLESQSAPFARRWRVDVSAVKLDVLDRVAKCKLIYTCASS